jgi:hypothetical protein
MAANAKDKVSEILSMLNEKDLSELDAETILNMRKELNPYGRTIQGSNQYINFSITLIQQEYWKKFMVTSLIAFLNRMCDEWHVPEGLPVVPVEEYLQDPSKLDTPASIQEKGPQNVRDEFEFNRQWMQKRIVVKAFLEEMFQFNPDEHTRSAYVPNRADKTRKPIETAASLIAINHLKKTDPKFKKTEETYEQAQKALNPTRKVLKKVTKTIKGKDGKEKKIVREVLVEEPNPDYKQQNPNEESKTPYREVPAEVAMEAARDKWLSQTVREIIPPHDVFGRFKLYYQSNYEELRQAVADLYCEKPEFELAINPYSCHNTADEAEEFKKKNSKDVIAEVFTVATGKWNFFDCFKEQREKTNYFNENTAVLEAMMAQLERDEKLGQDMLKKRVEKKKKQNVLEAGPDAETFKKWRAENAKIKELDKLNIGDKASDECPDDAVEVGVWKVNPLKGTVEHDKFYTKAEAPSVPTPAAETVNKL